MQQTWEKITFQNANEHFLEMQSVQTNPHCSKPLTTTIRPEEFNGIDEVGWWFTNNVIDISFKILEDITNCEAHKITLTDTAFAKRLCNTKQNMKAAEMTKEELLSSEEYSPWLGNWVGKDFIFIPVNDPKSSKLHRSLLVVDTRGSEPVFRHFDSGRSVMGSCPNGTVARSIAETANMFLRALENLPKAPFSNSGFKIDANMPHQAGNNLSDTDSGNSACGPYLWAITKELLLFIIESNEEGYEIPPGNLFLTEGFPKICEWDSENIRERVKLLVKRAKELKEPESDGEL